MSATGTKEKRTKIDSLRPPREIVSNTKARRAWLATELAKVQATPNRDGKIVGTGSYQEVSVYEVIQVAGRLRHRGICQFCGHSQVVENGELVLHGYKRPGDGATIGRCPAAGHKPLNVEKSLTEQWSAQADADLAKATQRMIDATAAERAAMDAKYGAEGNSEKDAQSFRPQPPRVNRNERLWTESDKDAVARHKSALKVWRANFPLTATLEAAKDELSNANQHAWRCKMDAEHFRKLLDSGTFGTALEAEVVA